MSGDTILFITLWIFFLIHFALLYFVFKLKEISDKNDKTRKEGF
ncbi:hypothetical protein [Campylobacter vulpis]|nr:hypothetical protein [Campylobacter vulpis]